MTVFCCATTVQRLNNMRSGDITKGKVHMSWQDNMCLGRSSVLAGKHPSRMLGCKQTHVLGTLPTHLLPSCEVAIFASSALAPIHVAGHAIAQPAVQHAQLGEVGQRCQCQQPLVSQPWGIAQLQLPQPSHANKHTLNNSIIPDSTTNKQPSQCSQLQQPTHIDTSLHQPRQSQPLKTWTAAHQALNITSAKAGIRGHYAPMCDIIEILVLVAAQVAANTTTWRACGSDSPQLQHLQLGPRWTSKQMLTTTKRQHTRSPARQLKMP
jgi:hypothetical protein